MQIGVILLGQASQPRIKRQVAASLWTNIYFLTASNGHSAGGKHPFWSRVEKEEK
jgi:hypothetical protein